MARRVPPHRTRGPRVRGEFVAPPAPAGERLDLGMLALVGGLALGAVYLATRPTLTSI